jgi:type IV pilus assembly protein PilO
VLGVTVATLAIAFYAFIYRPNSESLEDLDAKIQTKQRDLQGNKSRVQILPEVMNAVNVMSVRLEGFNKKLPRQPDLGPFISDITELSHQAALRKVFVEPGVPHRADAYAEWPIALKFEGDFLNAFEFLRRAEDMNRLTRVKGLRVRSMDGGKSGQVQVELSMNIYFSEG